MSISDWREQLPAKVRVLQIIIAALFFGCFNFLIIAALVAGNRNNAVEKPTLTYIALAFAASILIPCAMLPRLIVAQGRKKIRSETPAAGVSFVAENGESINWKAGALMILFQTKAIVLGAMLEGAVFFLTIAYIIEHSPLSLIPAIALMLLLISLMPTTGRVTIWIEGQMKMMDEERQFQ